MLGARRRSSNSDRGRGIIWYSGAADMTSNGDEPPKNGKHVRSHSLKSFPAVAAALIVDGNRKQPVAASAPVDDCDPLQTANSAAKTTTSTSTWKQVFISETFSTINISIPVYTFY